MAYRQLSNEERYQIAALRQQRLSCAGIAAALKRHRSTIAREVKRNTTPYDGAYRPNVAVEMTNGRRRRSRRNARYGPEDYREVEARLLEEWSPEQIVGRFRREKRRVMSRETIYLHVWADKSRGGTLWRHLRGAQKRRRKRYHSRDSRGRLAGKKLIGERPPVVEVRGRFGDWEGDTVHGRGKACVVTAVERKSGLLRVGPIARATADETTRCMVALLRGEPHRVCSLTTDNGTEFHGYEAIERELETKVYFATPHHAWERGTNENTNGLLRQYLPKGTDLAALTLEHCDQLAMRLNHRPRLRLNFQTPFEVYYASVLPLRR
jgi:transposase, IS30 family